MKYAILIFTTLLMVSCNKTSKTDIKTGKALFYSDIFVAANCKIDSVSIFIDNEYKGRLTNSFLPLSETPNVGDTNLLFQVYRPESILTSQKFQDAGPINGLAPLM